VTFAIRNVFYLYVLKCDDVQAGKAKKEQTQRNAEFRELRDQMEAMSGQLAAYNSKMDTMRERLHVLEASQNS
jgi:predicted  nucleic acid-binding Zn-ribbon protein